jgi:hypothetical protein
LLYHTKAYIKLGKKCLLVKNTPAYYATTLITAPKSRQY